MASPARSLNAAFQISTTRPAMVSYAVDITVAALLLAGARGTAYLEYADASNMAGATQVMSGTNSTSGVLNLTSVGTVHLGGWIPAGKYVRLRTENNTGSPTFAMRSAQEVLM